VPHPIPDDFKSIIPSSLLLANAAENNFWQEEVLVVTKKIKKESGM